MIYTPGLAQHTDWDRFYDTMAAAEEGTCPEASSEYLHRGAEK